MPQEDKAAAGTERPRQERCRREPRGRWVPPKEAQTGRRLRVAAPRAAAGSHGVPRALASWGGALLAPQPPRILLHPRGSPAPAVTLQWQGTAVSVCLSVHRAEGLVQGGQVPELLRWGNLSSRARGWQEERSTEPAGLNKCLPGNDRGVPAPKFQSGPSPPCPCLAAREWEAAASAPLAFSQP